MVRAHGRDRGTFPLWAGLGPMPGPARSLARCPPCATLVSAFVDAPSPLSASRDSGYNRRCFVSLTDAAVPRPDSALDGETNR